MTPEEKLRKEDREWLIERPQFKRLLFEILSEAGINRVTRDEQQRLFYEGRRSLGLEILGWFSSEKEEPFDVIASAIGSRMIFTKGASNDRRNHDRDE